MKGEWGTPSSGPSQGPSSTVLKERGIGLFIDVAKGVK